MPTYTDTLPQITQSIVTITIRDLIKVLPDKLPWRINVWLGNKLARYGVTTENIIFLTDIPVPTIEQRNCFDKLVSSTGLQATLYEGFKNEEYRAVRIYNEGRLIIDREKMVYTELPTPVFEAPILTLKEVTEKLPAEIPFTCKLYITGGLVKNGWSAHDADFLAPGVSDGKELRKMSQYFTDILGWRVDVGQNVMEEREPVYLYLYYQDGKCLK